METKKVNENSNFKAPQPLWIDVSNLSYSVSGKKNNPSIDILNNLSSYFKPGEVTGILGPVGAGKTSFLNCLSKRTQKGLDGKIIINNEILQKKHKKLMGYVLQRDYLFSQLSVEDSLSYTAALRRGDMNSTQRKNLINEILELMRLTSTKSTRIGDPFNHGISGGEMKRVNITSELISNPSIFLLDEPTSGLDSSSAVAILDTLNQLARMFNLNIILSIHQPSSQAYSMLDRVIVLCEGHFVYQGLANELVNYLEYVGYPTPQGWNVSDYVMVLLEDQPTFHHLKKCYAQFVSREKDGSYYMAFYEKDGQKIPVDSSRIPYNIQVDSDSTVVPYETTTFRISNSEPIDSKELNIPPIDNLQQIITNDVHTEKIKTNNFKPPSWLASTYWIIHRSLKKDTRGELFYYVFLQTIAMALISGALWWKALADFSVDRVADRIGFLFFSISTFMFIPSFIALLGFLDEREIISKERATKTFGISPYLFAKTVSDVAIFSLTPTVYAIIAFSMAGLPGTVTQILGLWIVLMITLFVSHSFGMLLSSMVTRFETGSLLLTVSLLTFMLTGGYFIDFSNIPQWLGWVRWLSVINYTVSIGLYVNFIGYYFDCSESITYDICPIPGSELIKANATGLGPWLDFVCLIVIWTVSKAATYAILRWGKQLKMS